MLRAEAALVRLADSSRTVVDYCKGVHDVVDRLVPSDRWCAFAVDPATRLATNGYHDEGLPATHLPRLLELEHTDDDVNQIRTLARTPTGVATLSEATAGDPATSARWRDVLEPSGLPHELRAVVRDRGASWGAIVLLRAGDSAAFGPGDVDAVARCSSHIAAGFRRVLVRQQIDHGDDAREAGIVIVDSRSLEVRSMTAAAAEWLERLDDGWQPGRLPTSVLSAVYACRSASAGGPRAVRARARDGRWVTITAEHLGDADAGSIGLVVQPSRPAEIATIAAAAHGLTPRETDVVLLVAAGHSNREIASILGVSPLTVGDHLKKVFAKLEVASRGEATSKLFNDHYLPRELAGRPAGADGWFVGG